MSSKPQRKGTTCPKRRARSAKRAKAEHRPKTSPTLEQLADVYLDHLRRDGAASGTQLSYANELRVALKFLGPKTRLSALTPAKVSRYFESSRVTKTRDGKSKAQSGVAKTRRVFRLALEWAEASGLVSRAPVPDIDSN